MSVSEKELLLRKWNLKFPLKLCHIFLKCVFIKTKILWYWYQQILF